MIAADLNSVSPILQPGRNCWTPSAAVDSCGLLVDGRAYYSAFHHAAGKARSYILIAGWKFNSTVRLLRGEDADGKRSNTRFLPFLKELCDRNPDLHIYILAWNYSHIYSLQWEWFLASKFNKAHERIHFCFDGDHAIGGSHHQKFVVIDGQLAFVGGLDFNSDDWDDRLHHAENHHRADIDHEPHGPYHDAQVYLSGPAVRELKRYFATRWNNAGNPPLALPDADSSVSIEGQLPIQTRTLAFAVNQPRTMRSPESLMHIRNLYCDAISNAKHLIYIENQYFTSSAVSDALIGRMKKDMDSPLDIAIVLPKTHHGWLESMALEPARLRVLEAIRSVAQETGHRLGIYYSAARSDDGEEVPTLIHSKMLIVDDRFLTVGSANISNRSMGLDTELNIAWEALGPEDRSLAESIYRVRLNLVDEHCGFRECDGAAELKKTKALVPSLDKLIENCSCRLRRLTRDRILQEQRWIEPLERWGFYIDPDRPVIDDWLLGMQSGK